MTYSEKLKDPRWQKKRLQVLKQNKFTCVLCGDKKTELHVHHKSYIKGNEPWEYDLDNFQALCKHCHKITEHLKGWIGFPVEVLKILTDEYIAIYVVMSDGMYLRYTFDIDTDLFQSGGILNHSEFMQLRRFKKRA